MGFSSGGQLQPLSVSQAMLCYLLWAPEGFSSYLRCVGSELSLWIWIPTTWVEVQDSKPYVSVQVISVVIHTYPQLLNLFFHHEGVCWLKKWVSISALLLEKDGSIWLSSSLDVYLVFSKYVLWRDLNAPFYFQHQHSVLQESHFVFVISHAGSAESLACFSVNRTKITLWSLDWVLISTGEVLTFCHLILWGSEWCVFSSIHFLQNLWEWLEGFTGWNDHQMRLATKSGDRWSDIVVLWGVITAADYHHLYIWLCSSFISFRVEHDLQVIMLFVNCSGLWFEWGISYSSHHFDLSSQFIHCYGSITQLGVSFLICLLFQKGVISDEQHWIHFSKRIEHYNFHMFLGASLFFCVSVIKLEGWSLSDQSVTRKYVCFRREVLCLWKNHSCYH